MRLTIPPSPAHLADLRRAAQASLRDVPSEVAEEVVLAVDEAVTNAILYGSGAGQPVEVAVQAVVGMVRPRSGLIDRQGALVEGAGGVGVAPVVQNRPRVAGCSGFCDRRGDAAL
jgi:Histidine kinase-like ATPase domain